MKAFVAWDAQDPDNAGWSLHWLTRDEDEYVENHVEPMDANDEDDPQEAIAEGARFLKIDADEIGVGDDDRECDDLWRTLEELPC
jgi:hypothetical protein